MKAKPLKRLRFRAANWGNEKGNGGVTRVTAATRPGCPNRRLSQRLPAGHLALSATAIAPTPRTLALERRGEPLGLRTWPP